MDKFLESVKKVIELLEQSKYAVVITGPGILNDRSIEANYDSINDRLPKMVSPEEFTIRSYNETPDYFIEDGTPFFSLLYKAKPNDAHFMVADLEKRGLVKTVITLNIDGLHQMAGSKNVLELCGSIRRATCAHCEFKAATDTLLDNPEENFSALRCPECGMQMKPDVVSHGDPLPPDYYEAKKALQQADLVIIIGSDMQDPSDSQLITNKKELVVINKDSTYFDQKAKIVIYELPARVLKLISERLNN